MLTLISTVVSFLMGGLPKLLDFFQNKSDKAHELELARMQIEREILMMKEGYAAQAHIEDIKTEQITVQAEAQTHLALLQHDIEVGKGASQWVINARAMVRPFITYGMFMLLVFVDAFGFWYACHTDVPFSEALDQLWDDESQQIFASIIAFYFGGQAFKK